MGRSLKRLPTLDRERLEELERRLGHRFVDRELIASAVTHRSALDQGPAEHYERLEFLGDAVLDLVTAEWLFLGLAQAPEGELARTKSYLVSADVLARMADWLDLGELLILGAGEEHTGGRRKTSLLADSLEAVFGAVFIDQGFEAARAVIRPLLERAYAEDPALGDQDAKTRLQELLQATRLPLPEYRLVDASGPDHERTFSVECWAADRMLGSGTGPSKKVAEQRAARVALGRLARGSEEALTDPDSA